MGAVKAVGVRELKSQLSAYLRCVKSGDHILVTERGTVIAELRQPGRETHKDPELVRADEWVAAGRLVPRRAPKSSLPGSPLDLEAGTAGRLLDEERRDAP